MGGGKQYQHSVSVDADSQTCTISENLAAWKGGSGPIGSDGVVYNTHQFKFDHVYDQDASQDDVYERSAKEAVLSTLLGYNAAMLAYGQTGTGKTYTMEGDRTSIRARAAAASGGEQQPQQQRGPLPPGTLPSETSGVERGIIPRAIEDIFGYIQGDTSGFEANIWCERHTFTLQRSHQRSAQARARQLEHP